MIERVRKFALQSLAEAPSSHDWDHTLRVFTLCMHIGPMEGADPFVLQIASYLHDVGRPFQDSSKGLICHAERGAAIASELLGDFPLGPETRSNIIHCIRSHRFRGNSRPETLEAKVLFDADKLDSIGAVGIGRAFLFAGEVGARLHNPEITIEETRPYTREDTGYREFKLKLCRVKDRMLTSEGRRMAEERHAFMESFFERFLQEVAGKI
ncbi:MAG: phosphohydrolase [Deltaproteobacteria bacterium HGW-Deltaproteobacteria-21]|nr:MAG: phosphohydrolase [Deltaproteobacteria bacterium HGW-Deltaproteobacteria-21]